MPVYPGMEGQYANTKISQISPCFRAGETYAFSPDITEEETYKVWVEIPAATFVDAFVMYKHLIKG